MKEIETKKDKTKVQNPHDMFFRSIFANLEVSQNFLMETLPESILKTIDLNNLELQNGTYISKKLKETRSDLLFRTTINHKEGYLYLLFEHKSYLDKNVGLQLLNYQVSIWNQKIKNENAKHIPVIIPMVIYHGKQDWKLGNALDTMIQDYDELSDDVKKGIPNFHYQKGIPNFHYHVYDLNRFSDEEIINGSLYYVATSIMKHVNRQDPQALFEALKRVAKALNGMNEKETAMEYFETCLRYVYEIVPEFSYDNANMLQKYVEQIFPEGSEVAMTLAEVLREEGVAKGEIKTLIKMAIKLLTQKFGVMPAEYSEAITKLDSTNLEILIDGIKGFEDLDDVKKFLAL